MSRIGRPASPANKLAKSNKKQGYRRFTIELPEAIIAALDLRAERNHRTRVREVEHILDGIVSGTSAT